MWLGIYGPIIGPTQIVNLHAANPSAEFSLPEYASTNLEYQMLELDIGLINLVCKVKGRS